MRLLLLSNSMNHGRGYLDHAAETIGAFFAGARRIAFVPYALHDQTGYVRRAAERLGAFGLQVEGVPEGTGAQDVVSTADGVFVGGGNTFRLLKKLHASGLVAALRRDALAGKPYLGASAGTVVAAPTLGTTNDMPIVEPPTFRALGLLPFHVNCHYVDADPASTHMGETRETRLREFLEENDAPVVGLREGGWLVRAGSSLRLDGGPGARLFRRGAPPEEIASGSDLSFLLGGG